MKGAKNEETFKFLGKMGAKKRESYPKRAKRIRPLLPKDPQKDILKV